MGGKFRKSSLDQLQEVDKSNDYVMGARTPKWLLIVLVALLLVAIVTLLGYFAFNAESLYAANPGEFFRDLLTIFM